MTYHIIHYTNQHSVVFETSLFAKRKVKQGSRDECQKFLDSQGRNRRLIDRAISKLKKIRG